LQLNGEKTNKETEIRQQNIGYSFSNFDFLLTKTFERESRYSRSTSTRTRIQGKILMKFSFTLMFALKDNEENWKLWQQLQQQMQENDSLKREMDILRGQLNELKVNPFSSIFK
jgi:cell division protein FtsB